MELRKAWSLPSYMRLLLCSAALGVVFLAPPAIALPALSLNGAYESERDRNTDQLAKGYTGGVAIGLGDYVSLGGNYSQLRTEPFTDTTTSGGTPTSASGRLEYRTYAAELGIAIPLGSSTGLDLAGGYAVSKTIGLDGFSAQQDQETKGPIGSAMLTQRLASHLEIFAGPNYSYFGRKRGWDASAGIGIEIAHGLWLNGTYWGGQTRTGWTGGVHMDFGE